MNTAQSVQIVERKIFILDQGAHRQLLNSRLADDEINLRTRAIYLLQRITAMRISEALALNIEQIWDGHDVLTYVALRPDQTKGKRNGRNLSLLDQYRQAQRAVREYIRWREKNIGPVQPNDPLFTSQSNDGMTRRLDRIAAARALKKWAAAAGLPIGKCGGITTHTARHTKLSEAVNKGDVPLAMAIAGHRNPETLSRYIHVGLDRMHDHNLKVAL